MKLHWALLIFFAVLALPGFCGVLTPPPDGPNLKTLDWRADEFSRREIRDGKTIFVVEVPPGREDGMHGFKAAVDMTKLRGREISFLIRYKATAITEPAKPYWGGKFMLSYRAAPDGAMQWPDANLPHGSTDWRQGAFIADFSPNALNGEFILGMQNVSGKIEFEIDSLECGYVFSPDKRINLDYIVKYPDHIANRQRLRGVMISGRPLTGDDIETLVQWNVNLVRAQITRNWGKLNTELDIEEYHQWLDRRLDDLENNSKRLAKHGIKIVIDLHSPPGGKISQHDMRMFQEKKYAHTFLECWRKIASRFKGNPQIHAYNLVNEPVQATPSDCDYWELQRRAAELVRSIDPDTPIMIESNRSNRPQTFAYLSPLRMDNVIYKVHMYFPLAYTHQRLSGNGPFITYPGVIDEVMWDKERIRETLKPVREFQLRHQCKIYVGEFSAIIWAPGAEDYIRDCIEVFEEYGWDWSYHAFRESPCWNVEFSGTTWSNLKATPDTLRKEVLLRAFKKNERLK